VIWLVTPLHLRNRQIGEAQGRIVNLEKIESISGVTLIPVQQFPLAREAVS
jgi:hypothetical protein